MVENISIVAEVLFKIWKKSTRRQCASQDDQPIALVSLSVDLEYKSGAALSLSHRFKSTSLHVGSANFPFLELGNFEPHLSQKVLHLVYKDTNIMAQTTSIAVPGQLLGAASEYLPGPGTHIHNSNLYASILGPITKTTPPKPPGPQKRLTKITPVPPTTLPTISIERNISISGVKDGHTKAEVLPEVNSMVLCRVTRITPRQAAVAILVVGETVLDGEWQGLIRVQDVRATEKDKVKIFESFRPGDIVRAIVVSHLKWANWPKLANGMF
jgi:exosome complex component CSL4